MPVEPIQPRQPGPPKVPRAVRERQMLEVATRVFAQRGYDAASIEEIAEGAGISRPMVYAYFGSKEGLYAACIQHAGARLLKLINVAASADVTPEEQLWAGIVAFFDFVERHGEEWRVLYREAAAQGGPFAAEVERVRGEIARLVAQQLGEVTEAEGIDSPLVAEMEWLAHALVGAAESLARLWPGRSGVSREDIATRLMNFAWLGFDRLVHGEVWIPSSSAAHVVRLRRSDRATRP